MKKIILLFTALSIVMSMFGTFTVFAGYTSEYMKISTLEDLEKLRDKVNSGKVSYITADLTADIDMSESYGEGKKSWTSIGTSEHSFNGFFLGNGHTINACITGYTNGLFGYTTTSGHIRELNVSGSVTAYGSIYLTPPSASKLMHVGAIVGYNKGDIRDCRSTADVAFKGNFGSIGGIAGTSEGDIVNCYNTGKVTIMDKPGGSQITNTERSDLIQNCFYLSEEEEQDKAGAYGKTAEQFASGEVAYLLNGSTSDEEAVSWYQNIGSDAFPVLDNTHSVVYMKYYNDKSVPNNRISANLSKYLLGDNSRDVPHIFKSYDELKEYDDLKVYAGENSRLLEMYPQEFFEDKFLYVHYIDGGSGTNRYTADVSEEANSINIEVTQTQIGMTDDYEEYCIYAGIDKSLEDKNINVTYNKIVSGNYVNYFQGRINTQKDFLPEDSLKLDYKVISSIDELRELWQGDESGAYLYDERLFYTNSLLVVSWQEPQQLRRHDISNIVFADTGTDIILSERKSETEIAPDVMTDYSVFIVMPKSYANTKVKITVEKEKIYPYKITGLCLTDTAGNEITAPEQGKSFIVESDIVKTEERNEKDYFFVAVYDENDALIGLDYVKAKFAVDGECSFGFNIPAQEKAVGSIKVFVWEAFDCMDPLAETKSISF